MPSKLKKAIAAVKDQTSISLAKVGGTNSSSLEVAILKATTHEEGTIDERYVTEVLQHVSSNRSYARSCARAIGRRIGRTKNWVVAVKSLMLVLRIFQDGDPHFPKEVLHAMKRGYKILNLASFRDESTTSCPWDFTAFVRTFALYLDERLDCFLTGKLQRRTSSNQQSAKTARGYSKKIAPFVREMKPSVLLDRITHWQRLLDRAIAAQPTGAAKTNRLVKTCLYAIVQETFELYRDISDGLSILLDGFFHLQYNNCVIAFQTCGKASKQFEELGAFHHLCQSIGVGRTSEYPNVQKISDELLETLEEFLKDQSSFPGTNGTTPGITASLPPLSPRLSDSRSDRLSNLEGRDRSISVFGGAQSMSLEDLITTDPGFSPDRYSDPGRENPSECDEFFDENDNESVRSDPTDHRGITSVLDLLSLDGPSPPPEFQDPDFEIADKIVSASFRKQEGWELVLFETSNQPEVDLFANISENAENPTTTNNYSNPFLEATVADLDSISGTNPTEGDVFGSFAQTSFGASFSESGFPGDLGLAIENNTPTEFKAEFGNDFPSAFLADFAAPTFQSEASTNNSRQSLPVDLFGEFGNATDEASTNNNGNNNSHQSLPVDLFGEFGNAADDFGHSAAFSADGTANDMNAVVPFNPEKNEDFFASGPGFQAAPTFRANSIDMDSQDSNLGVESDPFGCLTAMPAVEQQQQLWLQNQNKILSRHLT
ncbi:hypothetical protein RND81_14G252100 [Saponaria officinalis]|uniref:ENTH domain-containing protein n=1 Tax=Saponaria officinalis TaxID=3572 RepID=A0AAW1GXU3_SAPOF